MDNSMLVKTEEKTVDIDAKLKEIDEKFNRIGRLFGTFNDELRTRFDVLDKICQSIMKTAEEIEKDEIEEEISEEVSEEVLN